MPFCHKCGAQNEPEAVYCEECGSRLVTAGQPVSPGAPASVEPPAPPGAPPAPIPLADAGVPVPPEPPPPAGPPTPRRIPWRLLGALVLVAALVAGVVGIYFLVSANGGGDEEEVTLDGGETQEATVAPSPTVKATPKRTATPKTTVSPKRTPTLAPKATPTEEALPPAASQEAQVKAIAVWVEEYGEQYAGDCETTDVETDVGKYCSTLWEDRGDSAIYAIGLAFSEYGFWLLLERVDNDWVASDWADVVAEEMVPPW